MKTAATILLGTLLFFGVMAGCKAEHGDGDGGRAASAASAPVCFQGTGLRSGGGSATEAAAPSVLVLDSVVEPGGRRLPARVVSGAVVRTATWQVGPADTIGIVQSGSPLILYTVQREQGRLVGSGTRISAMPGVSVDTTPWRVELTEASCQPVLDRLKRPGGDRSLFPADVRAELAAMGVADQAARKPDSLADPAFIGRMVSGDSARTRRLQAIIAKWGWPSPTRAGVSAAEGAFLVVQHTADTSFQRRMLPELDTLARGGELDGQDLAVLTDRVLKGRGLPQRYGTQFDLSNSELVLYPIADSAGVEARRDSLGLMPLADYERMLASLYKLPVKH